ncbi:MAG: hypothetical protein GY750_07160 [Lentisphaerae bacterium]|nr:hypothetical protein [Lentisphaerota bacterium]MCP4101188.1 hypothetical protein [Lentisphaerota bacterium]
MHAFGGYTVSTLFAEPASTFFLLIKMVDRVAADAALEIVAGGIASVFGSAEKKLKQRRGSLFKKHTDKAALKSLEGETEYYKKLAEEYMQNNGKQSVIETVTIEDIKGSIK